MLITSSNVQTYDVNIRRSEGKGICELSALSLQLFCRFVKNNYYFKKPSQRENKTQE